MFTYDQQLWITANGEYRVIDADRIVAYGRSLGSLGKIASRLRKQGPAAIWAKLPGLPAAIREAIIAIAAHQDGWAARQEAEQSRIDEIGRWED